METGAPSTSQGVLPCSAEGSDWKTALLSSEDAVRAGRRGCSLVKRGLEVSRR